MTCPFVWTRTPSAAMFAIVELFTTALMNDPPTVFEIVMPRWCCRRSSR